MALLENHIAAITGAEFEPATHLRANLPPMVDAWFVRALQREPDRRYGSAKEMAAALRTVAASLEPGAASGLEHAAPTERATGGEPDPARLTAALATVLVGLITKNVFAAILAGAATLYGLLLLIG